jgi:hypothetical protein
MRKRWSIAKLCGIAAVAASLATLGLAGGASAELVKEFTKFQQCPWTTEGVNKCVYSLTTGGEVKLGSKTVPIEKPVVLQGGVSVPVKGFATLFEAKNKETLEPVGQPVPGGLAGLVPPESSPPLVKAALKFFFENKLTGVEATLELARPAGEVELNEVHLAEEEGVAVKLPVKIHLENPFLGESCFVGSESSPIWWELTTGFTNPPEPIEPIRGVGGTGSFREGGKIFLLSGVELVENAWSAPKSSGCGGLLSALVDPIIDSQAGLPSGPGENVSRLQSEISLTTATSVKTNDEENP